MAFRAGNVMGKLCELNGVVPLNLLLEECHSFFGVRLCSCRDSMYCEFEPSCIKAGGSKGGVDSPGYSLDYGEVGQKVGDGCTGGGSEQEVSSHVLLDGKDGDGPGT